MSRALELFRLAMDLGRLELTSLNAGDLDEAEGLARKRGELLALAMDQAADLGPDPRVLEWLTQHKELQEQLSAEVLRKRDEAGAMVRRSGQQVRRLSGYRRGTRAAMEPTDSRFFSKHS